METKGRLGQVDYWKTSRILGRITKNQIKLIVLDVSRSHHALGYQANNIQLHEFSDASEVVYDAVVYLGFIYQNRKATFFVCYGEN